MAAKDVYSGSHMSSSVPVSPWRFFVDKPVEMASFLRTASGMSKEKLDKLRGYMDALSEQDKDKEGK